MCLVVCVCLLVCVCMFVSLFLCLVCVHPSFVCLLSVLLFVFLFTFAFVSVCFYNMLYVLSSRCTVPCMQELTRLCGRGHILDLQKSP